MTSKDQVPRNVTPELFEKWRAPVRGATNPQRMDNPIWEWLVRTRLSAYQANELMNGPSSMEVGPCWCFDRFGQTRTELPDGRVVLIGGEHEDHYDPDFYIYNDVVVVTTDGWVEIYGYPLDSFPATDFHSATLIDGAVLLIGNLSYPDDRRAGYTQVLQLDLETLSMSRIETSGSNPGWIHRHAATLTEDGRGIVISGGTVDLCDGTWLVENIDDWCLDIETWRWERLSAKTWPRFEIHRKDQRPNHLWHLRQLLWSQEVGWDDVEEKSKELTDELGDPPRLDVIHTLYSPGLADEVFPESEDEHNVYRIRVGDVVVRYVEDSFVIQVTVEGELAAETVQELKTDLIDKFGLLEQTAVHCRDIPAL